MVWPRSHLAFHPAPSVQCPPLPVLQLQDRAWFALRPPDAAMSSRPLLPWVSEREQALKVPSLTEGLFVVPAVYRYLRDRTGQDSTDNRASADKIEPGSGWSGVGTR